jgi:hypothetical protein
MSDRPILIWNRQINWVGSIGFRSLAKVEVGVATSNGRSYYMITSLLKRSHIPYIDIILQREYASASGAIVVPTCVDDYESKKLKLIITTRKERLEVMGNQVVCIEDLGEDAGLAQQRLLCLLHPLKESDHFVVGIDPGQRTGIAAFMNHIEVESDVLTSVEDTITRARRLLDNAPNVKRVVKIGSGMPLLAEKIAGSLEGQYGKGQVRIQLVDERGTSSLYASGRPRSGTRDQRSARLIAFREGRDYVPPVSLGS